MASFASEHSNSASAPGSSRVNALRAKHSMYKDLIKQARKSPSTTDFYLRQLKKQKLIIKEELENITPNKADIRKAS